MAYSTSSPPVLIVPAPMGASAVPSVWAYSSADVDADVDASGYFTNGDALGMKVGDIVIVRDTATPKTWIHVVITVASGGAATVNATGNALGLTEA